MFVYEVVNTETNARGCITSMFPDLEQGVTVRHRAYQVRIASRAMSYKAALDNQRQAHLPVFD